MPVKIAERFSTQCATVFENNYDTCGTITRASIAYLTPEAWEGLFSSAGLFADLSYLFETALEMKACGTKTNGMYDWIMSGADTSGFRGALKGQSVKGSPARVPPFVLAKQDSVINSDFWALTNGWANSAYAAANPEGPLVAADLATGVGADRVIRVVSRYGIELDPKWFNPRTVVYIFTRTNGITENGAWRVLASAAAADGSYVDVLVTTENAGSTQSYNLTPTTRGVLVRGVNNVNDYESWCNNMPNYDGRKIVPFWAQTMRRTRCVDEQYREFFARLNEPGVNRAFREFGDLDLAQRNAQDEKNYQKEFVNAFFFQKPWNASQAMATWTSLPTITTPSGFGIDPGTGGKLISYRANFIGVVEQLQRCGRVDDLQGNPLNFYEWLDENYRIMRARETRKGEGMVKSIDWWTDSAYRARLMTAFLKYWKQESLDQFRITYDLDQQKPRQNALGFTWDSYYVKYPAGLQINIVSHPFFDDWRDAHKAEGQEPAGIILAALDIGKPSGGANSGGSIYWASIAANRVTSKRGELQHLARLDRDWSCVMESVTEDVTMTSETGTVIVECPQDNEWIWGIGDADPIVTGKTAPYDNMY